jgi:hypothetical protein
LARTFIKDLSGGAATPKSATLAVETPASALIAIFTVGSYLKTTHDLAVDTLGIPGAFLPPLIALATFIACVVAISSKDVAKVPAGFAPKSANSQEYSYGLWTRRFAKLAIVALLFIIPYNVASTLEEILPLPSNIAGVIFDARTRAPAIGAKVRIVNSEDVDVTGSPGTPDTDSQGIFFVNTQQRVRRSAKLVVYRELCKPTRLTLWKRFQTSVPSSLTYIDKSTSPFFTFYAECTE